MNKARINNYLPPDAEAQNQLNRIAGNLLFVGRDKKSFAVTSCHDGEGKSTTAVQLAYTLVREGYRVVLIDAVPNGSSPFGYMAAEHEEENRLNITDYLYGKGNLSDLLYLTDVRGFFVFPLRFYLSDRIMPPNPKLFADILDCLSKIFDFILVDTPSAGQMIDASTIAYACDGIVLVVKYKSTKKKDVAEVVRQLERSGTPILGCVINKVKFDSTISKKRYRLLRTPLSKRIFHHKS